MVSPSPASSSSSSSSSASASQHAASHGNGATRVYIIAALASSTLTIAMALAKRWMDDRAHTTTRTTTRTTTKRRSDHSSPLASTNATTAHEQLIENGTPMVHLRKLSAILGRSIYAKMECMNPGGTGKDRAALSMIRRAEREALLPSTSSATADDAATDASLHANTLHLKEENGQSQAPSSPSSAADKELHAMIDEAMKKSRSGGLVVEGTSGSTGIALATLCAARGHACLVVLPDDQAVEKQSILRSLGAVVHVVPTAAISNPNHYVNIARNVANLARQHRGIDAVFINQFENEANFEIHYRQTGPEILRQCPGGSLDAFVMSAGTGGTIAGVGKYLREHNPDCKIVLVDPPGSALFNKIQYGVAYASEQAERKLRRHRYDTLAEGIGLDRVTQNFELGVDHITDAIRVADQEAVDMAHWLLQTEGLWVGSSSAMNVVGAVRSAMELPQGSKIVAVICDGGQRHATRFWNPKFIEEWGLEWPLGADGDMRIPECLKDVL